MSGTLAGKIAIVTGAGRGIGAATAKLLAERGARVALVARTSSELELTARAIGEERAMALTCDLSDPRAPHGIFSKVRAKWGAVDILVNNAATFLGKPATDITLAEWDHLMAINVRAVFALSQEFLRQKRPGAIVNMSSLGGLRGTEKFPGFSAYSTSKFAVVGLTETLAVEGAPLGVRVNCVAPGAVDTKMLKEAAPFLKTRTTPEDIAKLIAAFADESESGSVTGSTLEVYSNV